MPPEIHDYPSGSLTNYPVSFSNLSKQSLNQQYISMPKLSCMRKTSIEISDNSVASKLITGSTSRTLVTSNSKVKSNNSGMSLDTITAKITFQ